MVLKWYSECCRQMKFVDTKLGSEYMPMTFQCVHFLCYIYVTCVSWPSVMNIYVCMDPVWLVLLKLALVYLIVLFILFSSLFSHCCLAKERASTLLKPTPFVPEILTFFEYPAQPGLTPEKKTRYFSKNCGSIHRLWSQFNTRKNCSRSKSDRPYWPDPWP